MSAPAKPKGSWGGRREGAGAKPLTDEERLRRRLAREEAEASSAGPDPVAAMAELIGLSPRVAALRPDLADRFEVFSPGEHLARFARTFCRYTQLGEVAAGGPKLGDPFEMEAFEREFDDEALSCDKLGRRIYQRAGLIIPRKNRKTTRAAVFSLYFGSPADGEHRPLIVQAAGVKDQAGKLYETTKAFIDDPAYGSPLLRRMMLPSLTEIRVPSIAGMIKRVAGDGDNNHSLDPHVVCADELHTWKTPKQRENWKALTTAQGGRRDPFVLFISTEGDGEDNELAATMERVELSDGTELEHRRAGLTIYRNLEAGLLIFRYAIPARATVEDLDAFEIANPAPWRTRARIKKDLADPMNDDATKLRLYGNRRGSGTGRWISDDRWTECRSELEIPDDATLALAVDAAHSRDTTAVAWAWLSPDEIEEGLEEALEESGIEDDDLEDDDDYELGREEPRDLRPIIVRASVWSCIAAKPHHTFVGGGRLDNDLVEDFIRSELLPRYVCPVLFYDPAFFSSQAERLSRDGLTVVEMIQKDEAMKAAWNEFHEDVYTGATPLLLHDGDPVVAKHVKNASGTKVENGGWVVRKAKQEHPIDALAAMVMARYGARHMADFLVSEPWAASW